MRFEKLTFAGSQGLKLAARLDLPDDEPAAYALFAHCFTGSKDVNAVARIAEELAKRGIATLRFDFTGLGDSEGDFANTNFSSNIGDLLAAADFLRRHYDAPKVLIGHSLGGAAVLAAASQIPEAVAVATIGAPAEPAHVTHHFTHAIADIEAQGEAEVKLGGRPFRIRKQFIDDIARYNSRAGIAALNKALIVFHSPQDSVVGIENARMIFEAAKHPKSFISLDDADHMLSQKADARYVARVLAAWAQLYIGLAEDADPKRAGAKPAAVVVSETGANPAQGISRLTQSIAIGPHRLSADEPRDLGGGDLGPNPYDLLLAALGACTSMTLRLYADHKGWKLDKISVHLNHQKIHAADCADCDKKEGRIDQIERVIELTGTLDETQTARLLEIADKCPVHRTLQGTSRIATRIVAN